MIKKSTIQLMAALSAFAFITACDQASDTLVNVPNVAVECSSGDDPGCSSSNSCSSFQGTVVVIMTRSGCGESAAYEPVATGSVNMTCDPNGCDGTVTQWTDPTSGDSLNFILTGRMDVCSSIDLGCNSGDLSNSTSQSIQSSSTLYIDSWQTN